MDGVLNRPAVDHLQTQPLYPVPPAPAPLGAIPAQRVAETSRPEPEPPAAAHPARPDTPREHPRSAPRERLFVGAAILTGCALLSSLWGTVVTSRTGDEPPPAAGASAPVTGPVTVLPTQLGSMGAAPVPGQIGGEGIYGVGADLQPGTYRTAGPSPAAFDNCYWERSRDTSGQQRSVIASGVVSGPFTVTIKGTDKAFKTSGCETWTKVR